MRTGRSFPIKGKGVGKGTSENTRWTLGGTLAEGQTAGKSLRGQQCGGGGFRDQAVEARPTGVTPGPGEGCGSPSSGGRQTVDCGQDFSRLGHDPLNFVDPARLHCSWVFPMSLFTASRKERQLWGQLVCFLMTKQRKEHSARERDLGGNGPVVFL